MTNISNITDPEKDVTLGSADLTEKPDPTAHHLKVNVGSGFAERMGQEAARAQEAADRRAQPKEYASGAGVVHLSFDERQMLTQAAEDALVWPTGTFEHVTCSALAKQGLLLKVPGRFLLTDAGREIVAAEAKEDARGEHVPDFIGIHRDDEAAETLIRGGMPN